MKSDTQSFYEKAVRGAVEHIADHLDEALDLRVIAHEACLSPLHFHRIFRWMVGETPLELHRRWRLERAATELAFGQAPVTRVAFEAGYETHESFTRAFGDHYGAAPSAFRARASDARAHGTRPPQVELAARCGLHFGAVTGASAERPRALVVSISKGDFAMHVEFKELPGLRVAAVQHLGPYSRIVESFQRLDGIAGRAGLVHSGTDLLAIYYDDPETTPVDALRSDAGVTVDEAVALPPGVVEVRIPAARYAWTTHRGPYAGLGDAWARLVGGWLPESGERAGQGPSFEIYRNEPSQVPLEELRTELYLPLA